MEISDDNRRVIPDGGRIRNLRKRHPRYSKQEDCAAALGMQAKTLRAYEYDGPIQIGQLKLIGTFFKIDWRELVKSGAAAHQPAAQNPRCTLSEEADFFIVPRHDTDIASLVMDETRLIEDVKMSVRVLSQVLMALSDECYAYAEELIALLGAIAGPYGETRPDPDLATRRRIHDLLVRLKGNDVWVYADHHMKFLPEMDALDESVPRDSEFQMIIAFGPPGEFGDETISIKVDNGRPARIPTKIVLPPSTARSAPAA